MQSIAMERQAASTNRGVVSALELAVCKLAVRTAEDGNVDRSSRGYVGVDGFAGRVVGYADVNEPMACNV
jgi:hypothetical protein